jgi:hypothetical protein
MAAPFRVRDLAGAWHAVELAPDASEAGIKEAVAGVVRLAPGTFSLTNDRGSGSVFHAGLVGDWRAVQLQGQPVAGAASGVTHAGAGSVASDSADLAAVVAGLARLEAVVAMATNVVLRPKSSGAT